MVRDVRDDKHLRVVEARPSAAPPPARRVRQTILVSLAGLTLTLVATVTATACRGSSEGQPDRAAWQGPAITDLNAVNARDTGQWKILHKEVRDEVLSMRARADNPSQAAHIAAKLVQANKNMGFHDIQIDVIGPDAAENAAPIAHASLLDGVTPAARASEPARH